MKEGAFIVFLIAFFTYLIFSIAAIGITASVSEINADCNKTYRYDYIFPARKIGCWLGKEIRTVKKSNKFKRMTSKDVKINIPDQLLVSATSLIGIKEVIFEHFCNTIVSFKQTSPTTWIIFNKNNKLEPFYIQLKDKRYEFMETL